MTFDVSGGNGELINAGVAELDGTSDFGGIGAAGIRYWAGRNTRYIDTSANSYVYFDSPNRPIGSVGLSGMTNVGRRNNLRMGAVATYEPTMLLSGPSAAPVAGDVVSPAPVDVGSEVELSNPPPGVIDERWLEARASVGLQRVWTTRQRSDVRYERSRRQPLGGPGFDSRSQLVELRHAWSFSPRGELQLSYRSEGNRLIDQVPRRPLRFHVADGGIEVQKPLAAGRSVSMTVRAGAAFAGRQVDSDDSVTEIVSPVASLELSTVLSRRWTVSAEVRREVSVLEGLSPEGFATDVITAATDWGVSRRVLISVAVDRTLGTALVSGLGSFDRNTATAGVRYGIAPWCAVFSSFTYYEHRYRDIADVPEGFPAHYNRRSVWFGLNLWLPLFGTF
jgi:hypothetical protein